MTLDSLTYEPPEGAATWRLVALHGWGANAADLGSLAPYLRLPGFTLVFPEAPWPHPQVPGGRMWYGFPPGYDFCQPHDFGQQGDLQASRVALQQWLQAIAADSPIPLERTVLAGFSQGGAITLDLGWQLPLAGQISLSGYLHGPVSAPVSPRPLTMVHGVFDPVVPLQAAYAARDRLEQQGQPVHLHELAMGHEVSPEVIALVFQFCEDLRRI